MALIRCPECGTRISDKARTCPSCGYESQDSQIAISQQEQYHPVPVIQSEGERWEIIPVSDEDNGIIMGFLSKFENLKTVAPGLAETLSVMFSKTTVKVAKISEYTQALIDSGKLKYVVDKKTGDIIAELADAETNKISNLIRLKDVSLYPGMSTAANNLSNQVAMAQIMEELQFIEEKMANIQLEMQEDRLAMADSAWDKMMQARNIEDYRLKTYAIQNAINAATDAKRVLMRNFVVSLDASVKLKKPKDAENKAQDAVKDLVALTNCVHIECDGYVFLGEHSASKECLKEFLDFIKETKLDDRNTLLRLNENLAANSKLPTLCDDFTGVVARMDAFVTSIAEEPLRLEA